jgi:hypothetical protein
MAFFSVGSAYEDCVHSGALGAPARHGESAAERRRPQHLRRAARYCQWHPEGGTPESGGTPLRASRPSKTVANRTLYRPGTGKYVDALLAAVLKSKPISLGPASVQQAVKDAISASKAASYVTWLMSSDTEKELRTLHLDDGDIALLKSIPLQTISPVPH